MDSRRFMAAMLGLAICCCAPGAFAQLAPQVIVSNGDPVGLDLDRSSEFTQEEGYIEQAGSRYLYPQFTLPSGDFTVVFDISWEEPSINGSHGHTIFAKPSSNNVVIFAGGTAYTFRMRYITGSANENLYDIGPFNDIIPTGQRFQFEIKSKNGYWSYWVDGVKVADAEDHGYLFPGFADGDTPEEFGIRPWSNTVRVFNWHQYGEYLEDVSPVSVPDLGFQGGSWQSLEDAEAALTAAGLTVGSITQQWSDIVPAGMVISQDPAPGGNLPPGTAVNLVVSLGAAEAQVPAAGAAAIALLLGATTLTGIAALRRRGAK